MRLTNSTLLRGYNRDLQRLKTEKNACERKITSTRKFSRASEAPLLAAKALNVRKSQYYSEQYKENLKVAQKFYTEAETSLLQVSTKMADIRETIIAACNTTKDNVDYNIYAQQLETFAHELCTIFNTDSAGRAIFGGESDSSLPFTIINDANGNASIVLYHGVPVNALNDYFKFPFSNPVYMDIGLGMVTDQTTHAQDPMSVLDISFNGTKISGCGAEYGIADIDLTSIKENRNYAIDVYADGVKHTITFRGKGTQQENIDQINDLLKEAFSKEAAEGKNVPVMDKQGMIYLQDKYGNALDKGIVSVVNNTTLKNSGRVEQLVVDNDSNYTNKYRANFSGLPEGQYYRVDVELDGVRKEITFMSGADEDETLQNFQEALNDTFGEGVINVTDHAPNKGVVSSEGSTVKLWESITTPTAKKYPSITTETFGLLDLDQMDNGEKYTVIAVVNGVEYEVEFEKAANGSAYDTYSNLLDALAEKTGQIGIYTWDNDTGVISAESGPKDDDDNPIKTAISFRPANSGNPAPLETDYQTAKVDLKGMVKDEVYVFNITVGDTTRKVKVVGGADPDETLKNLSMAVSDAFKDVTDHIYISGDGEIVTFGKDEVTVEPPSTGVPEDLPFERERIFSNNYIQLTLDAARALRNGDIEYANGCIDRLVSASESLLAEIANIGCNEEFCDFNLERLTTREENLDERQNELEITDPEYQITLWKTYEAYYNACLQMSASVVPNSIFNYMK